MEQHAATNQLNPRNSVDANALPTESLTEPVIELVGLPQPVIIKETCVELEFSEITGSYRLSLSH